MSLLSASAQTATWGSGSLVAAGRTGFVRLRRGHRVLVNPLRDGLEPDPTRTESWALTYGDVELL